MRQEKNSGIGMESASIRPSFTIKGCFCGDKTFPSLNLERIRRQPADIKSSMS